jgi:hypothetical protein
VTSLRVKRGNLAMTSVPSILTYFCPQTENDDTRIDHLEAYGLSAEALGITNGVVTPRVEGFARMHHAFYPGRPMRSPCPPRSWVCGVSPLVRHQRSSS